MQISEFMSQYHNTASNSADISGAAKGVEQYTQSTTTLKAGHVFEGSVNSIKDGTVVIGLSSGQTLTARLDKGVSLLEGSSLFFQVKSNEGGLIQIRPVPQMSSSNPTLLNALDAAGVGTTEKTLTMVNAMMGEQMPIDADSVVNMNRTMLLHPDLEPSTVVTMTKLNIPVTGENAAMYENYIADKAKISDSVKQFTESLTDVFSSNNISSKELIALNKDIVSVFSTNKITDGESGLVLDDKATIIEESSDEAILMPSDKTISNGQNEANITIASELLSAKENSSFSELLKSLPSFEENNSLMFNENGLIKADANVKDIIKSVIEFDFSNNQLSRDSIKGIFSHEVYSKLLNTLIEDEWSLLPTQVSKPEELNKLYEKVLKQTEALTEALNQIQSDSKGLSSAKESLSDIRSNISFMDQMNQFYSFVQIPLKLNSQLQNSELYVYQNKRKGANSDEEELSAFLHFDLPALGSTDISVKLLKKNVSCNWYLENERSMDLIEQNIDRLEAKLNSLGYNCNFAFEAENKKFSFEDDFLRAKIDTAAPKALVHRYSFDVRA